MVARKQMLIKFTEVVIRAAAAAEDPSSTTLTAAAETDSGAEMKENNGGSGRTHLFSVALCFALGFTNLCTSYSDNSIREADGIVPDFSDARPTATAPPTNGLEWTTGADNGSEATAPEIIGTRNYRHTVVPKETEKPKEHPTSTEQTSTNSKQQPIFSEESEETDDDDDHILALEPTPYVPNKAGSNDAASFGANNGSSFDLAATLWSPWIRSACRGRNATKLQASRQPTSDAGAELQPELEPVQQPEQPEQAHQAPETSNDGVLSCHRGVRGALRRPEAQAQDNQNGSETVTPLTTRSGKSAHQLPRKCEPDLYP
ncbi:hypothetical protein CEK25_001309 [Fusarium fujikuroi]|nr:hypothetical protein CEK25_001309 [Fusarium fujikuroi]